MKNKEFLYIDIPQNKIEREYNRDLAVTDYWREKLNEWREAKKKTPEQYFIDERGYVLDDKGNLCKKTISLGTFEVESGELIISDPCYDVGTWCQGIIDDVRNGTWKAYVEYSEFSYEDDGKKRIDKRISRLYAFHNSIKAKPREIYGWQECDFGVGVDSGQAGIFDRKYYKDDKSVKEVERTEGVDIICEDEPFYSMCCDRTLGKISAGTLPYGCVSSSGFGDGSYTAWKSVDNSTKYMNKVDSVVIVFLGE